jgi:hypothetical protein
MGRKDGREACTIGPASKESKSKQRKVGTEENSGPCNKGEARTLEKTGAWKRATRSREEEDGSRERKERT